MGLTLSQVVNRHFASDQARLIREVVEGTPLPPGRLVLRSMETTETIDLIIEESPGDVGVPIEINADIPLKRLVWTKRDLEAEGGIHPTLSSREAEHRRIPGDRYSLYGVQSGESIALLLVDKSRDLQLRRIPGLHKLPEFETVRFFLEERENRDGVTGLYSRNFLDRKIRSLRRLGVLGNYRFVVADLDHFKALNERWGYAAGNRGLEIMGDVLLSSLGEDGLGSRRRYGDETASLIPSYVFDSYPGGALQWANDINAALAERSRELPGGFLLRLTFGISPFEEGLAIDEVMKRADRGLVYAKTNDIPLQEWRPDLPDHKDMQSGAHLRFEDPELVTLATAARRSFPKGVRPDQVQGVHEIVEQLLHSSPPLREAANEGVVAKLSHHLILTDPSRVGKFTAEDVWDAMYHARMGLGLLDEFERGLCGDTARIAEYLGERLNLEVLLTTDTHRVAYNDALWSHHRIACRYDDALVSIADSQHQSRLLISGRDLPTTGEVTNLGHLLHLLTTNYYFQEESGIVVLRKNLESNEELRIFFDKGRFDISGIRDYLAEDKARRVQNHLGLERVSIRPDGAHGSIDYYHLSAKDLTDLVAVFWLVDEHQPQPQLRENPYRRLHLFHASGDRYGAQVPHIARLVYERSLIDHAFIETVEEQRMAHRQGSSTRVSRRIVDLDAAMGVLAQRYESEGLSLRSQGLPIVHATAEAMVSMLSDLYAHRGVDLSLKDGVFTVSGLRVAALETPDPESSEVFTYIARKVHGLLNPDDRLFYRIDRGQPRLGHEPEFVELQQLTLPVSTRYAELFSRFQ